jgi:putative endonuclease
MRRLWEHKNDFVDGFCRRHGVHRLVWYEVHATAYAAISREKLVKKWHRDWKINLIQGMNPGWKDLYAAIAA